MSISQEFTFILFITLFVSMGIHECYAFVSPKIGQCPVDIEPALRDAENKKVPQLKNPLLIALNY